MRINSYLFFYEKKNTYDNQDFLDMSNLIRFLIRGIVSIVTKCPAASSRQAAQKAAGRVGAGEERRCRSGATLVTA